MLAGCSTTTDTAKDTLASPPSEAKVAAEPVKRPTRFFDVASNRDGLKGYKKALQQVPWTREHLALYIYDLNDRHLVWQHNARTPFRPASVMKLVTSITALELLGSQYRGQLQLLISAEDAKALQQRPPMAALHSLKQPLVLRGNGHSALQRRDLLAIDEELTRLGIAAPTRVVLDRSYLPVAPLQESFDENPLSRYNVVPDALMLEQNMQAYQLASTENSLQLRVTGLASVLNVDSRALTFNDRPCAANRIQELHFRWTGTPSAPQLAVSGQFPRQCSIAGYAQLLPADWGWQLTWNRVWPKAKLVALSAQEAEKPWYQVAVLDDEPLSSRLRTINKFSDNAQARMLFAALGTLTDSTANAASVTPPQRAFGLEQAQPQQAAQLERASIVVQQFLKQQQIDTSGLTLENGSGLSRSETLTAELLGKLLQWQWTQPSRFDLLASLPIGGVDGTLRKRFKATPAAECAFLKTGTLRHTTALAGYLFPPNGNPLVLVAIVNDEVAATEGVLELNRLVNRLCQGAVSP